jgi:transposase-like protein
LLTRLLKKQGVAPKRMITDKLGSHVAARRQVMPDVEPSAEISAKVSCVHMQIT